jgi:RNA polymerase sigma-70 factor (ECF subfamily)
VNEEQLLRRLRARDERAFTTLVITHQTRVYGLCLRMVGNAAEAEDLAQEVFVRAFQAVDRFRGDSLLSTWLYRIGINLCKNRLKYLGRRGQGRRSSLEDVNEAALDDAGGPNRPLAEPRPRPDHALEGNEARDLIQSALDTLDPEHRELLVLRDIEGLSYAEVVGITGLPVGTVKSRLHRARAALREAYLAAGGELC